MTDSGACYDKACDRPATKMIIIRGGVFEIRLPACTVHADEIEQDHAAHDTTRSAISDCGGNS